MYNMYGYKNKVFKLHNDFMDTLYFTSSVCILEQCFLTCGPRASRGSKEIIFGFYGPAAGLAQLKHLGSVYCFCFLMRSPQLFSCQKGGPQSKNKSYKPQLQRVKWSLLVLTVFFFPSSRSQVPISIARLTAASLMRIK